MVIKEKSGSEVTLEKQREMIVDAPQPSIQHVPSRPPAAVISAPPSTLVKEEAISTESSNDHVVKSPMVGTFYRSPSPDEKPYVQEGDVVQADTVICIIEAMKVMNEVKAGKAGVVRKALLKDGDPVEFNSSLFTIG